MTMAKTRTKGAADTNKNKKPSTVGKLSPASAKNDLEKIWAAHIEKSREAGRRKKEAYLKETKRRKEEEAQKKKKDKVDSQDVVPPSPNLEPPSPPEIAPKRTPPKTVHKPPGKSPGKSPKKASPVLESTSTLIPDRFEREPSVEVLNTRISKVKLKNDKDGSFYDMEKCTDWHSIPVLELVGDYPLYTLLLAANKYPEEITGATIASGNQVQRQFSLNKAVSFVRCSLQEFQYHDRVLEKSQQSRLLKLGKSILRAWNLKEEVTEQLKEWKNTDNSEYRLVRAFTTAIEEINQGNKKCLTEVALCGNLVRLGTAKVLHQQYQYMPTYHNWLLEILYGLKKHAPAGYSLKTNFLWESVCLGILFPISMGINRARLIDSIKLPFFGADIDFNPSTQLEMLAISVPFLQLSTFWQHKVLRK